MISLRRAPRSPIGLEIRSESVSLVQLAGRAGDLHVETAAAGSFETHDLSGSTREERLVQLISDLVLDHGFRGRRVVSCLGAGELFVQNVRLPQLPPDEIPHVVRFEAEERLPYPIIEAEIRHLMAGQVRQDAETRQEVILLATRRARVSEQLNLLEQAGLAPVAVDVEPCAVVRALARLPQPENVRTAYLNLGESATTVLFSDGHQILFLKYIHIGGQHLDQAVSKHLGMSMTEAARMRRIVNRAPALDADDEIHRSVIDAIRVPLDAITTEIELCLRYYKVTFRGKPLDRAVLCGSEATRWLEEFLTDRLGVACGVGDPFQTLGQIDQPEICREFPWQWSTAVGLALH